MMRKKEGYAMDNKGSTLIEIVVSVLIIAIVFVPLLMGMNAALKANGKAEQALNSENAAVNCMEVVKALGKKGVEALAPTQEVSATGTPAPLTPALASAFGSNAKIIRKTGTDDSGKVYEYFEVSDLKEGLETYTAKIRFSDENYVAPTPSEGATLTPTPLFNDYEYISFSNLSGKGTQMLQFLELEDEARVTGFRSLSGKVAGTEMVDPSWTTKDIVKSKEIEIIIDKVGEDYTITTESNYELYNHLDGKYLFTNSGEYYAANDGSPRTIKCKYGKPDTLVIYYSPIEVATTPFDHESDRLEKNKIKIVKNTEIDDLRVYVIVTGERMEDDGTPKNNYVEVDFDEDLLSESHKKKNNVFCSATFNSDDANRKFEKIDNLYQNGGETLKIYDVIVEVEDVEKTGTVID